MAALAPMLVPVKCPVVGCATVIECTLTVEMEAAPDFGASSIAHVARMNLKADTAQALVDVELHLLTVHGITRTA